MPSYRTTLGQESYRFDGLAHLMAVATPERSGDQLAGIAAESAAHRVAARYALADLPLQEFLSETVVPYEARARGPNPTRARGLFWLFRAVSVLSLGFRTCSVWGL